MLLEAQTKENIKLNIGGGVVTIIYKEHATTADKAAHVCSGWQDRELTEDGVREAEELGKQYENEKIDVIFCSDLKQSFTTAEIAFGQSGIPILKDERLRECNYGSHDGLPNYVIEPKRMEHLSHPYPGGESYEQAILRVKDFLKFLLKKYNGCKVVVIGHRAPLYALERFVNKISLEEILLFHWRWKEGGVYELENVD